MGHGTTRSSLAPEFQARIADLGRKALKMAEYFRNHNTTRPWHTPDSMKKSDLLDVPALHEPAWNRNIANENYVKDVLLSEAATGTHGDLISLSSQIDFMAVEERAWRARHATFVRCAAHAHGRLNGHGNAEAGVFALIKNAADNNRLRGASTRGAGEATPFTPVP